jgi:hypothetical protein
MPCRHSADNYERSAAQLRAWHCSYHELVERAAVRLGLLELAGRADRHCAQKSLCQGSTVRN